MRNTGEIGYYKLDDWWFSEFSNAERRYIEDCYSPFTVGDNSPNLTSGTIGKSSASSVQFLTGLASWFKRKEDLDIAKRILAKAEAIANSSKVKAEDLHFMYGSLMAIHYKDRANPDSYQKAIESAERMIEIAPKVAAAMKRKYPGPLPAHRGYEQLAIIREKEGDLQAAIALCSQALKQGWAGDWEKRIERYQKKADKNFK